MKAVDTKRGAHTHIGTKADGRELRASIFENGGNGEKLRPGRLGKHELELRVMMHDV